MVRRLYFLRPASTIALVALIAIALPEVPQSPPEYPKIHALGPEDLIFEQLSESIEAFHPGAEGGGDHTELPSFPRNREFLSRGIPRTISDF